MHSQPGPWPDRDGAFLRAARRIVLKVGTSTLTGGRAVVDPRRIAALAEDVAASIRLGRQIVVVSSGAIVTGAGRGRCRKSKRWRQ